MSKRCRTAHGLGSATTIAALPPEILEHIFSFVEPQIRKSTVLLVCKSWKDREAAVPQHPISIEYESINARSRATFDWLINIGDKLETSRLQKVYLSTYSDTPEQDTEGINKLLTMLAAKRPPLTSVDLNFGIPGTQSHFRLVDTLVRLRELKSLEIATWQYSRSDIPLLIELSSLQNLQVLCLNGVWAPTAMTVDDSGRSYGGLRQAFQSLTALTKLCLWRVEFAGWLFESPTAFCTQLRRLEYEPDLDSPSCMDGAAYCISSMPILTSLHIGCASALLQQIVPSLHALEELEYDRVADFPVLLSAAARVTSLKLSLSQGLQADDLNHVLPFNTLRHLSCLDIEAGSLGESGLPDCWSQLSRLWFLSLPRCSFLPVRLASLPRLRYLAMHTCPEQNPLGAAGTDSVLHLVQSIPQVSTFRITYHTTCEAQADVFRAEISRVQQLVPTKRVVGLYQRDPFC